MSDRSYDRFHGDDFLVFFRFYRLHVCKLDPEVAYARWCDHRITNIAAQKIENFDFSFIDVFVRFIHDIFPDHEIDALMSECVNPLYMAHDDYRRGKISHKEFMSVLTAFLRCVNTLSPRLFNRMFC